MADNLSLENQVVHIPTETRQFQQPKPREEVQENSLRRGKDVAAAVLGMQPREKVKSPSAWEKSLTDRLVNPSQNPSMLKLKQAGQNWVNQNISIQREPGMTEAQFTQSVSDKRAQYVQELDQLIEAQRRSWEVKIIGKKIADHIAVVGESPIPADRLSNYTVEEFALKNGSDGHAADILQVIADSATNKGKKADVVMSTISTWNVFRDSKKFPDKHVVQLILRDLPGDTYRSCVMPAAEPFTILNLQQSDYNGAAVHEAIHQVIDAQVGYPISLDFAEGAASRLADSLTGNQAGSINKPHHTLLELIPLSKLQTGEEVKSHTHLLELAEERSGARIANGKDDEASYLYGYAFMTALLQSTRMREYADNARASGDNPYGLLLQLNHDLTADSLVSDGKLKKVFGKVYFSWGNLSQREILTHVLQKNGFNSDEIFTQTGNILQNMYS